MRRQTLILLAAGFLSAVAGCAVTQEKKTPDDLSARYAALSMKFDLAKRENLNLKRELTLFRQVRDIDSKRFVQSSDAFAAGLAPAMAAGNVWVATTDRGLVVTVLVEQLFESGTDALSGDGKALLDRIADLVKEQFPGHYLYIEGHTDNQSLAVFEWKSDWDFSFARALAVLKYFSEIKGLDPLLLSASGFGQYRPRDTNETKEGRRLNRRVEIVISPQRLKTAAKTTGAL